MHKQQLLDTYSLIIKEFFSLLNESVVIKEMSYQSETIYIGLNTIQQVFEIFLLKTKNIEKAYNYAKKAYYYYLEYIEQIYIINITEKINYMDIIMFVYKKTIFEINNEYKIASESSKLINEQLANINSYINIYKTIVYKIIQNDVLTKNNIYIENFEKICKKINKTNLNNENVVLLDTIMDRFYFVISDIDYFFEIVQEFSKKMKVSHLKKYEKKIYTEEITEKLFDTPEKFISWFLI
jgi:hypothetical protein